MPGKSAEKERRAYFRTSVLTPCSTADCAPGRRPARFAAVGSGCRQAHRRGGDGHRPDQVRADRREGNMRIHTIVLAALLASAATLGSAQAATGVAFVHGTSKHTDAASDYWTHDNIDSIRQGLPDPSSYVVINCDFTQYMWHDDAAGCLAGQLQSFIAARGITDLVVITHSNGGNVMRWIMSNPTWDSRYPGIISRIRWVNALAPSSAGTPLADAVMAGNVFESALGDRKSTRLNSSH